MVPLFLLFFKCLHFCNTSGLVFCLLFRVQGKKTLYFKVCFLPDGKRKKKKKPGTLCTNSVSRSCLSFSVAKAKRVMLHCSVCTIYIFHFLSVSEVYNLSADALWSSPAPHFQSSVCFCCREIIGCTGLTRLKQASCLSEFR